MWRPSAYSMTLATSVAFFKYTKAKPLANPALTSHFKVYLLVAGDADLIDLCKLADQAVQLLHGGIVRHVLQVETAAYEAVFVARL